MQNIDLHKDERVIVIATVAGMSTQEAIDLFEKFSRAVQKVVTAFSELVAPVAKALTEYFKQGNYDEFKHEYKRNSYKLDFKRPKIRHQVLDRKPRTLIKKII